MARFTKSSLLAGLLFWGLASVALAQTPLENLTLAPQLPPLVWSASTDPKHQNNDFFLLKPGETRRVPLAAGTLERLWSTAKFPDQLDLKLEAGPRRSQLLLSKGKTTRGLLVDKAYTFFPNLQGDSLAKLENGAALVATNHAKEDSKWYFQVAVRPQSKPVSFPKPLAVARRMFKVQLAPGEEKIIEHWDNPGLIYEFSVASDVRGAKAFHNLRFKADFDGQGAVDAPLMGLAGQVAGEEILKNAVADFDGSRLLLHWPMPFQKASITLKNEGEVPLKLDVGARVSDYATAPSPYRFCAVETSATTQSKQPVSILNLQGAGAFVGLALSMQPGAGSTRRTFAYLEGNETITADGKKFEGTGTEDFFSSAWYYPDKPFFHPYEGLTLKTPTPPSVSAYRLMIPDAVPFQKSLKFDFEHGNGNNSPGFEWKWVAFWYQKPPLALPVSEASPAQSSGAGQAPVAPGERWKIWVAIGIGIVLGVVSALLRRGRRR